MEFRLINSGRINNGRELDIIQNFADVEQMIAYISCNSHKYSSFHILSSDVLVVYRREADGDFYIVGHFDFHSNKFFYSSLFKA